VVGTDSPFFGGNLWTPSDGSRSIPENRVLTNSTDIKLPVVDRARGQGLTQPRRSWRELWANSTKALEVNKNSSLGPLPDCRSVFFLQKNYQASANALPANRSMATVEPPLGPRVWSHLQLGKIFDTTGPGAKTRRPMNTGRPSQTNDNTQGRASRESRAAIWQKALRAGKREAKREKKWGPVPPGRMAIRARRETIQSIEQILNNVK